MITDFPKSIEFVLHAEGGYTMDPHDPGGETMFGVARKYWPNWSGWVVVDEKKKLPGFPENLNTDEELIDNAKEFYEKNFWKPCHCDELPFPFAIQIFDSAVNQGVGVATRLLQVSLGVDADGMIGPKTIQAAHSANPRKIKLMAAQRLAQYARLMADKPNLMRYAVNWSFRVIDLMEFIGKNSK